MRFLLLCVCWGFFITQAIAAQEALLWYQQAKTLYQEGNSQGALALLEELERRFPKERVVIARGRILAAEIYASQGKYQKVIELLTPLLKETDLTPRAYLLLARSAEALGLNSEALLYVRLLKTKFPEAQEICGGDIVAAKVFYKRKLYDRAERLAERVLTTENCSIDTKAEASFLLFRLNKPDKVVTFLEKNPRAKAFLPEVLKELALYHLKQGKFKQAEEEIYDYLNFSGREKEAPPLLWALAEALFKQKKYKEARRIYELILTSWPSAKQALFAKFRLYEMRYLFEEKIGHVNPQTRNILLNVILVLKRDYPEAPLTEEAHALEIKLLLEAKKISQALESAWAFLKKYPESPYLSRVFPVLCKASSLFEQNLLGKKDYQGLILFFNEHKQELEKASCGLSFYWAAQAYLSLNLETEARLTLLKGVLLSLPDVWEKDFKLTLVDLLLKDEEYELSLKFLKELGEKYKEINQNPYYLYLLGRLNKETGKLIEALEFLKRAYKLAVTPEIKAKIQKDYLENLIILGRYEKAFSLLQEASKVDLELAKALVTRTLKEEKYLIAQKVLSFLRKKFPEDRELLWLEGLLWERLGEPEKAFGIWQKLAKGNDVYAQLASSLLKEEKLIEEARKEIY
ncbi:tetratricopeptide repeat protein [Thermodesulfatator autotrophicus]|uniref:Outer membrane lipoprotein BamD-like domain-containing protein n=1 Tax=Thermodesulfatator autotrophicus TaxID=1795632 RepID=A0A177E8N9_9BACT|nr:tetratricopeptide repeat protein [Thermodesulfatator autotrophicus]OAG28158.1 hypothetical protein TH606_03190 [Thermodesulfatator autotrophicus]